jgi:hypothetical protein
LPHLRRGARTGSRRLRGVPRPGPDGAAGDRHARRHRALHDGPRRPSDGGDHRGPVSTAGAVQRAGRGAAGGGEELKTAGDPADAEGDCAGGGGGGGMRVVEVRTPTVTQVV